MKKRSQPLSDIHQPPVRQSLSAAQEHVSTESQATIEAGTVVGGKGSVKRRFKKTYLVIAAVAVIAIGGIIVYRVSNSGSIIETAVVERANFPVYAPSVLPEGYSVDDDQTNITDDVLMYVVANERDDVAITTTVQPWPTGFDMSKIVEGGSITGTSVTSGTLYNLSTESSTKYMLDMGGTLIFLTSPKKVNTSVIRNLVDNLQKIN